jgi:sortase A
MKQAQRRRRRLGILLGASLIAAGLAVIGVTGYFIWYDDIAAGQSQRQLEVAFGERIDATTSPTTAPPATSPTTAPQETSAPTSTAPPADFVEDPSIHVVAASNPAPVTPPSAALPTSRPYTLELPPEIGGAVGEITIPAADVDWIVVEGVDPTRLAMGPGHMPGTPLPGQLGNAVISGHRTTYGAPFNRLDLLVPGDTISVRTTIGTHVYAVTETIIVEPTAYWVTEERGAATLTLTTCHPKGTNQQRLIVFADLVTGPNADVLLGTTTTTDTASNHT